MVASNIYSNRILKIWGINSPIYWIYHEAEWSQTPSKFFLFLTHSYLDIVDRPFWKGYMESVQLSTNRITTYLLFWGLCLSSMLGTLGL